MFSIKVLIYVIKAVTLPQLLAERDCIWRLDTLVVTPDNRPQSEPIIEIKTYGLFIRHVHMQVG